MAHKDNGGGELRLRQVSYSQLQLPENQDQMDLKVKYITTAVIYYCNIALGVSATFLAPILIDFMKAFNTDMQTISLVFTVSLVSVLVGAAAFGVIFNYVNRHAVITFLLFEVAICLIVLPHSSSLTVFFILNVLMALGGAGYVTAQVVWVIEIWKEAAGPFIQAQHFFYAVGTMLPPLIFTPFLSNNDYSEKIAIMDNSSLIEPTSSNPLMNSINETTDTTASTSNLIVPCAMCGSIIVVGAILQLITLFAFKKQTPSETSDHHQKNSDGESCCPGEDKIHSKTDNSLVDGKLETESPNDAQKKSAICDRILLIALSAAFVGSFQSMEAITGQFLPSFIHFSLHLSEAVGAKVLSAYAIAFTVGRLAGIFIILKVVPQIILCGNFIFIIIANFVLLIWGMNSESFMWFGSILLGIGYSTSVPSVFAYIQTHLAITNVVGAILMVCGISISAVFPIIVGSLIKKVPAVVIYINFTCVVVGAVGFVCIIFVTKNKRSKK